MEERQEKFSSKKYSSERVYVECNFAAINPACIWHAVKKASWQARIPLLIFMIRIIVCRILNKQLWVLKYTDDKFLYKRVNITEFANLIPRRANEVSGKLMKLGFKHLEDYVSGASAGSTICRLYSNPAIGTYAVLSVCCSKEMRGYVDLEYRSLYNNGCQVVTLDAPLPGWRGYSPLHIHAYPGFSAERLLEKHLKHKDDKAIEEWKPLPNANASEYVGFLESTFTSFIDYLESNGYARRVRQESHSKQ
ncbi:MAG: hypothetical protein K6T99_11475 [Armatimonadetes bacterium]|nr:hypothetical protein [Armatimonadota bacterium]